MTLWDSPLFFQKTCILLHLVVDVLAGTHSITPMAISLSNSRRTYSIQWTGTVAGLCMTLSAEPALSMML